VPLLNVGTLAKIRDGSIRVRGVTDRFSVDGVVFAETPAEPFDAVVLAIGYRSDLRVRLPAVTGLFDAQGVPLATGLTTAEPGIFSATSAWSPPARSARSALKPDASRG